MYQVLNVPVFIGSIPAYPINCSFFGHCSQIMFFHLKFPRLCTIHVPAITHNNYKRVNALKFLVSVFHFFFEEKSIKISFFQVLFIYLSIFHAKIRV